MEKATKIVVKILKIAKVIACIWAVFLVYCTIYFFGSIFGWITDTHNLMQDVDQIAAIELGYSDGSTEQFQAVETIAPEDFVEFTNQLCSIPTHGTSPHGCSMERMIIMITYKDGVYEAISQFGIDSNTYDNVYGGTVFDASEFQALFEAHGVTYEP